MIKVIDTEELKEGDILAEPILNALGHILLPANASITPNSLKLLKTLNIKDISIKLAEEQNQNDEPAEEDIESSLKRIIEEIVWSPENDSELELLKIVAIHRLKKNEGTNV